MIRIRSEVSRLHKVIVHTPGHEVSLVNPELTDDLLFDDIIFEEDAREEHLNMLKVFRAAMPEDGHIYEIKELAEETLRQEDARAFFIESLIRNLPEANLHVLEKELMRFTPLELITFVVEGASNPVRGFNLHPAPNLLFTRDLAAVVGDHIILSKPARVARAREFILMDMIVSYHPLFEEIRPKALRISGSQSIEGGDVIVASEKVVLIGMSERTTFTGLMAVTETLLSGEVEYVVAVDIPKKRSSMHLDTIFTFADRDECVVFPPDIEDQTHNLVVLSKRNGSIIAEPARSLRDVLEELLGHSITFIRCGGEDRTRQFREQWTDGANLFALAPGIVVGYDRNTETFNAFRDHGYTIVTQHQFLEEYSARPFDPDRSGKLAITFQGNELCRGRGGARCMTLPILRK